jgi:hypothetical protein
MADALVMDRMIQRIMRGLVDTGTAPQYAEFARALGLGVEEGPSFPPLNNLPTQYRITVRGAQHWFAQCGFEATSVTWLFPGETVRVDAPCLDCGDPVSVEMRDGRIRWVDPPGGTPRLSRADRQDQPVLAGDTGQRMTLRR